MTKKIDNRREAGDMNLLVGRLGSIAPTIRVTGGSLATMVGRRVQECNATDLTYYGKQLAFLTTDLNTSLAKLEGDANKAKIKAVKLAMYLKFVRKLEKAGRR